KEYSSTCSIGGFITNTRDLEKSMENADKALYEVKNKGRNGIKIVADEVV
ncbi:MAG: diguanylate cyclase, partial [Treponema sp.]|nr:diguanylate cyclase [Treponema sp.]